MAEEEIDYVSDPEDAKLSLKMRRREASDDEEEEEDGGGESANRMEKPPLRRLDDSDGESEGAPADYEEEELEEEEGYNLDDEYAEEEEAEYDEHDGGISGNNVKVVTAERAAEEGKDGVSAQELIEETKGVNDKNNDAGEIGDEDDGIGDKIEDEKKEIEPYSVPTAGAFYMHDDRFRDNAGGRHRRMLGGRKLWESKDDKKWGHDKFEELTVKERHPEERKRGSRGRGRSRGSDRVYEQGNRPREYNNNNNNKNGTQNYNNQNKVPKASPKGGRGRGPRRYQPSYENDNEAPLTQYKQTRKSGEKHSYDSSLRTNEPTSNAEEEKPRKQVSSNLSVASPPFYPSSSSSKDNNDVYNKRDITINRNGQPSVVIENFTKGQPNATMRGKNKVDSAGMNNRYINDSKSANALQAPEHGQGRGMTSLPQMSYQSAVPNTQVHRVRPPNQIQNVQRNPGQPRGQFSGQTSGQQTTRVVSGAQAGAVKAIESGEVESVSDSSKSKTALVAKGKGAMQGSGSFMYGGPQVMGASGNMGTGRGDQNFPTFLPVMQFGAQHPGGMGVPAVGMAFPGYVGGRGNSEMTWLPVLAGAAGALGSNFCPPYLTVDGSYHTRPSGQVSSVAATSSNENNATKVGNDWNPTERPELASDESGQRQKNPRRYTEMKFDQ